MIEKMWGILTTFTEEARQAALSKCKELGLDANRGVVSLAETYINLSTACNILKDAIEKKKLIQLPITVQTTFATSLEAIAKHQTGLIAGSDEIENLAAEVERLNTAIWQYGLHNLSDEVLGYQTKLNQLKGMELAATEAARKLEEGIQLKEKLEQILSESSKQTETLQAHVEGSAASLAATNDALAKTIETSQKATESLTTVQQVETTSSQLLATSTQSNSEILAHETNIKTLVAGFTTLKAELEANKAQQQQLFVESEAHRNKINDLLDDANRTGLAASFTIRRRELVVPLLAWIAVFGCSIIGLSYIGIVHIAPIITSTNWEQLPARLALTAPLVWLGWFSAKQYGYTSRLREDYAYKEASAKSFEGYKREAGEIDKDMLKNLLDTAIKNLGDNPIRIYSGHENHASPLQELLEKALKDDKAMDLLKTLLARGKG